MADESMRNGDLAPDPYAVFRESDVYQEADMATRLQLAQQVVQARTRGNIRASFFTEERWQKQVVDRLQGPAARAKALQDHNNHNGNNGNKYRAERFLKRAGLSNFLR